ncbi:MAG: sodium:proton antiporter NhaD [Cytophagales bacterium]|nr:sodium:proton antiporter NhaD [Cytophagales bacterium]MDW8384458.1 sodium:proton antiporter NhaD [Flammeovirgaceae bacterium]
MESLLIVVFVIGYLAIAFEHQIDVNKAGTALFIGCLCWLIYIVKSGLPPDVVDEKLLSHIGEIAQIIIFLLGAMTIVEIIDAHNGFYSITKRITTKDTNKLLWILGACTFFLSAILDNLTTTIVMIALIKKLIPSRIQRLYFASMIVISANAGGAWSPMGDVTTTMLWIGGQITPLNIIVKLFIPSLLCAIVPILIISFILKIETPDHKEEDEYAYQGENSNSSHSHSSHHSIEVERSQSRSVLVGGLLALILVPVFKTITHLPPFVGVMMNLGVLWIFVEIIHRKDKSEIKRSLSVLNVIRRVDVPSVLFFLGILMAVSCLQDAGILKKLANALDDIVGNIDMIGIIMGILSAIIDNVPLVAAAMAMYDLNTFPTDHNFWELLAYCAGTGGSALIIGSAAGVAAMGLEHIEFMWYLRKVSWIALIGYFAGIFYFLVVQEHMFGLF